MPASNKKGPAILWIAGPFLSCHPDQEQEPQHGPSLCPPLTGSCCWTSPPLDCSAFSAGVASDSAPSLPNSFLNDHAMLRSSLRLITCIFFKCYIGSTIRSRNLCQNNSQAGQNWIFLRFPVCCGYSMKRREPAYLPRCILS